MPPEDTHERFQQFVDQLNGHFDSKAQLQQIPPRDPRSGRVTALIYRNTPKMGVISGFTYGLSLKEEGAGSGRELCITMRTDDEEWAIVPARIVASLRELCPFTLGMSLGYSKPYVTGSKLSSAFLAEPNPELRLHQLTNGRPGGIELVGVYPIYASERQVTHTWGTSLPLDVADRMLDPTRPTTI